MKKGLWIKISLSIAMTVVMQGSIYAATIVIPDGNFSTGGTVSGLTSHTDVAIGSTPWFGTNTGILTLLPPTLSLGSGSANINGLLGTGALGVLNNTSGSIFQTLPTTFTPNTTYTFQADVSFTGLLTLNLISNDSAGILLTTSTGTVLSSSEIPSDLLTLTALNSTTDRVALTYTTGSSVPTGGIGLTLFAAPTQGLSIAAASNVSFANLGLTAVAVPENNSCWLVSVGLLFLLTIVRKEGLFQGEFHLLNRGTTCKK